MINISIVEDNHHLRSGWQVMLQSVRDFEVLGTYGSCEDAIERLDPRATDVLLMDIGLPGMSGIDGVRHFSNANRDLVIVMVSVHDDDQHVFDALCAGAVGYLQKQVEPVELIDAIRDAKAGGSPMTPTIARRVISALRKLPRRVAAVAGGAAELTDKERDVLSHLAAGASYADVGKAMFLSVDGVRYHIRNIYGKLHVHSRAEAVAEGLRRDLIEPTP